MSTTPNLGLLHVEPAQSQKEVPINGAFDGLDNAINAITSIALTGSLTLTAAQLAGYATLIFTGALSGDATLTIPAGTVRRSTFVNQTNHTLTITYPSGGTSVTVSAGLTQQVHADGTNILPISQPSGGAVVQHLADLLDVDELTPPTDGQTLTFVAGVNKWEPRSPATASIAVAKGATTVAGADAIVFSGAGVSVADGGGGAADVVIPGLTLVEGAVEVAGANQVTFVGAGVSLVDNGSGHAQVSIPGGSGALSGLSDVDETTGPTDGQLLTFDTASGKWKPQTHAAGGSISVSGGGVTVPGATALAFTGANVTDGGGGIANISISGGGGGGGGGGPSSTRPALSSFTAFNPLSGTTWTDVSGGPLVVNCACQGGNKIQAQLQSIPAASWKARIKFNDSMPLAPFFSVGIVLCRSSDGALQLMHRINTANGVILGWQNFNNAVSYSGQPNARNYFKSGYPIALEIEYHSGTGMADCYASEDGTAPRHFLFTINAGSFMVADKIGVGINPQDNNGQGDLVLQANFYDISFTALT